MLKKPKKKRPKRLILFDKAWRVFSKYIRERDKEYVLPVGREEI